jgi:uncharacterized protein (DUF1330 family)
MPAYVFAEVEITNPDGYREYTQQVVATIQEYGGRFLHRGGAVTPLEGDWPPVRRVLIEFPTAEAARRWFDSPEYEKPKALRRSNSKGRLILLEGVSE